MRGALNGFPKQEHDIMCAWDFIVAGIGDPVAASRARARVL